MRPVERPGTLRAVRPDPRLGIAVSAGSVAGATAAIYALKGVAPVVSLSVVYLPAVLLVSAVWGLWLGLGTSLLSAAAFNFFHLPPVGRFTIADSRNWVALAPSRWSRWRWGRSPRWPAAARWRPTGAGRRPIWPPPWPGSCWAARRPPGRWWLPPGGWRRRSG